MALTQYPWLEEAAARLDAMRERLPNAILIHGMPGVGTFELARWFAERLLCESPTADGSPCGKCPGCRMMHANGHPDCRIVVSEFLANALDLPYTPPETSSSSKKLSREIRIHQFRALTDFLTMAPSRGGRRCVLVYPADMVRAEDAASLLKSMEAPPEGASSFLRPTTSTLCSRRSARGRACCAWAFRRRRTRLHGSRPRSASRVIPRSRSPWRAARRSTP